MKHDVRILVVGGALALAGYVALNAAVLAFAPMLHRLHCDVHVVGADGAPAAGVEVAFVGEDGQPRGAPGVTDAHGRASLELVFQQQAAWAFPRCGEIDPAAWVTCTRPRGAERVRVGRVSSRDPRTSVELVVAAR